jgi:hypothetical protein
LDKNRFFAEPVDTIAVPDYRKAIKHPMDFRSMQQRLESGMYRNLESLEVPGFDRCLFCVVFTYCVCYSMIFI